MENSSNGKAENFFRELGKRIDQFSVELKQAGSRVESELQQRYEELKASAEKLKTEAENKERWKEVEASLKKAGEELEKAMKAAFQRRDSAPGQKS
jgi:C4-dicarboxylate-specific signal transduction histidine kinase